MKKLETTMIIRWNDEIGVNLLDKSQFSSSLNNLIRCARRDLITNFLSSQAILLRVTLKDRHLPVPQYKAHSRQIIQEA